MLDRRGEVALETTVSTREPERLRAALAPYRPLDVVVETCPFWPWLSDRLVPAGIGFHLAHAKQLRAIAAAPQKSDAVDARLLGRMLLSGLIPEAYPRPADQRELLRLLRHRTTVVRYRTRRAGRIHAPLHQQRLSLPRENLLRQATRGWLAETAGPRLTVEQRAIVTTPVERIDRLTPLIHALERRIAQAAAGHATAPLLATDPRHRPVSEPALGGRALADHAVSPRRAPGPLRGARAGDAEFRRPHPPRQHSAGGQSVGARGAGLGDPDPCAVCAPQCRERGVRAAHGPAGVAGGPSGGRAEVGPDCLGNAVPPDALVRRSGGC